MREIKFRGLSVNSGNWVYGYLLRCNFKDATAMAIKDTEGNINNGMADLIPQRIIDGSEGQFTGLTDKNGVEIFEGDIFKVTKHGDTIFEIKYASEMKEDNHEFFWACFYMQCERGSIPFDEFALGHGEVIGNIHQNPELLS